MTDNSDVAKLRRAALNLLARRDYSRHEMANKLLRKAILLQVSKAEASKKCDKKTLTQQRRYDDLGFDDDDLESNLGIEIDADTDAESNKSSNSTSRKSGKLSDTENKLTKETLVAKDVKANIEAGIAQEEGDSDDVSVHVEPVLNWLTELNFLNDHRFVEAYIRYGIGRGHGLMRIRQDLQRKGIDKSLLADALESLETDWFELAADLRQRRFGVSPPKSEQKERARQMRFLQYRGFSLDQCFYALSRESADD
jgi:regulatory protein